MRSLIQTSDAQYQRDKEHLITANSSLQRLHKNQTFLSIKIKLSYKVKKETRRDLFKNIVLKNKNRQESRVALDVRKIAAMLHTPSPGFV